MKEHVAIDIPRKIIVSTEYDTKLNGVKWVVKRSRFFSKIFFSFVVV